MTNTCGVDVATVLADPVWLIDERAVIDFGKVTPHFLANADSTIARSETVSARGKTTISASSKSDDSPP